MRVGERIHWYEHLQRMEENNEVRAVNMIIPKEVDGLCPKGHGGSADHLRGCTQQKNLEVKNLGY